MEKNQKIMLSTNFGFGQAFFMSLIPYSGKSKTKLYLARQRRTLYWTWVTLTMTKVTRVMGETKVPRVMRITRAM